MSKKEELIAAVTKHVKDSFDGDWKRAFDHYDADDDGGVEWGELSQLLVDSGVGSKWTLKLYLAAVFRELDRNRDGKITWTEFETAFNGGGK